MHPQNKGPKITPNAEETPPVLPKGKAPAFQFYATDWLADTQLGQVSPLARGLWIDLLSRMWVSDKPGYLILCSDGTAPTLSEIAKACRSTEAEAEKGLKELERYNIFSKTAQGVLYSRRLLRIIEEKRVARETGKTGGNPWLKSLKTHNGGVKAPLKTTPNGYHNGGLDPKSPSSTSLSPSVLNNPQAPLKGGRRSKVTVSKDEHRRGF